MYGYASLPLYFPFLNPTDGWPFLCLFVQAKQETAEGRGEETERTQEAGTATREGEEEEGGVEDQKPGQKPEEFQGVVW